MDRTVNRLSRGKRVLFTAVMISVSAAGTAGLWLAYRWLLVEPSGEELNRLAWQATFRERGLAVPQGGPRDGYWGSRMPPWTRDPELGWHEAEAHLPGLVDEDSAGLQRFSVPGGRWRVLIVGGSVAWGAYASSLETTYFARLARLLSARSRPVQITVLAAGAWTSEHELEAFRRHAPLERPDLVLFLDGLNDFTQGTGSEEERVSGYLDRMREARQLARERGISAVFALQPFLLQKKTRSALEERILELSLKSAQENLLRRGYARIRNGLRELARDDGAWFVDCSDAFDGEQATTFTDLWHFPDPGHRILAERLAEALTPVLEQRPAGPGT